MITTKRIQDPIPYDDLSAILKDAFKERLDAGMNFACASFSGEDLKKHLSENALLFGAYRNGRLVGMNVLNSISNKFGLKYGTSEFVAVTSDAKHQGVGPALFREKLIAARNLGLDFILSDTAVPAVSSVRYHKKAGFKIYGYSHYPGRSYDSVNFIYPLTVKGHLLASWLGRKILGLLFTKH